MKTISETTDHTAPAEPILMWTDKHRRKPKGIRDMGEGRSLVELQAHYAEEAKNPHRHMLRGLSTDQLNALAQMHFDAILDDNRYILRARVRGGISQMYGI